MRQREAMKEFKQQLDRTVFKAPSTKSSDIATFQVVWIQLLASAAACAWKKRTAQR